MKSLDLAKSLRCRVLMLEMQRDQIQSQIVTSQGAVQKALIAQRADLIREIMAARVHAGMRGPRAA